MIEKFNFVKIVSLNNLSEKKGVITYFIKNWISISNLKRDIRNQNEGGNEMRSVVIKSELQGLLFRGNILQKEIAVDNKVARSTLNEYVVGGRPVPIEKAASIAETNGDDLFRSEMGHKYFGTIKALDGHVAEILTPTELDYLEEIETKEREERRESTKKLLIKSKLEPLNDDDRKDLEKYVMEFLDEIVVELSIVFSILKILGMSVTVAFKKRMPHWIEKKYMKGE